MLKFAMGLLVGLALGATLPSLAYDPCQKQEEPRWNIAPPRIGVPGEQQIYCMQFPDGSARCL